MNQLEIKPLEIYTHNQNELGLTLVGFGLTHTIKLNF